MRSTRGTEPGRGDRADAAARRLALLAADLGAPEPEPTDGPADGPADGPGAVPVVPQPGRHAARRRWELPGPLVLGAPQLTLLALAVAAAVGLTAWWVVRDQAEPVPTPMTGGTTAQPLVETSTASTPGAEGPEGEVTVDVTGKVRRPGIVVLDAGSRVVDALEAAGGERSGVDLSTLNLARVLVDGEQIVVGAPRSVSAATPSGGGAPSGPAALVNLNTATQAELETLPDVGPVTAASIVAWRDANGGFTSVDELLEVDGIGDVTLEKLAPLVTV